MRKSLWISALAVILSIAGTSGASAGFFWPGKAPSKSLPGFKTLAKSAGDFTGKAVDENGVMTPDKVLEGKYIPELEPVGTILSPKGENWFYILETDGDKMDGSNEYYTKWNFKEFKITVYDGKFNIVGYVHGTPEFPEGAARCNRVNVATQVTSNFFNSNSSDYEIVVDFNYNPDDTKYLYGAKQFSQAYTLQPAMPEEVQTPLFKCPGLLQGILNGSTTTTESFVLSFVYESTWDSEPEEHGKTTLRVYKPVSWGAKEPELIAQQKSEISAGDGINDAIPFFVVAHGSDVYSVRTYYEKPLFDYTQGDDPVMTPDNHFIVDLYKPTAKNPIVTDYTDPSADPGTPWKSVSIPMDSPTDANMLWRSYALGNFLGERDVTWDFSDNGEPCLIISIVDSNVQEESTARYRVYDLEGNIVKEFGTLSDSYIDFPALEGHCEQIGFQIVNADGNSVTQLVDWPSLEVRGEVPVLFEYDGNVFSLSSVPTRVLGEGGVLYAANVVPTMGDGESSFAYIAYFRPDGELHHMDTLTLPAQTAKAYAYVEAEVLDPYLYNTDSKYEYLIWLYTWKDNDKTGTDLSLCVVDNEGKILAKRELTDGHSLENAYVSNCPDQRYIVLSWRDASKGTNPSLLELISLPLNDFEGEGTAENPYIIRTFGDFDQVRNNLTSHFALAGDVDMEHRAFRPIEGAFTGSIDGRGHTVKDLFISAAERGALFNSFGQRPEEESDKASAVLKDITFDGVTFYREGSAYGTKVYSLLAADARYAEFNKVNVVNPVVEISDVNVSFGVLANVADNVKFTDCAVKGADIDLPRGSGVGGIVGDARDCEFRNVYVNGSLKARTNLGGIAGSTNGIASAFSNIHVDADLDASATVAGGVIGANNSRSEVRNSIVEGSITCSSAAGGIVGNLMAPEREEADDVFIIENNVVNLKAINAGDNPEAVHRIVGYSCIDEGERQVWIENPDWDESNPNSSPGEYKTVPASPEKHIGVNHVVSGIAAFDTTEGLSTEGITTSLAGNDALFSNLGFVFGSSTEAPWVAPTASNPIPVLYFEDSLPQGSGVESVVAETALTYRAGIISAPDARIALFDLSGRRVAVAYGELSTENIPAGIYLATAAIVGKTSTIKIMIR